jgi:hypothetical protein
MDHTIDLDLEAACSDNGTRGRSNRADAFQSGECC